MLSQRKRWVGLGWPDVLGGRYPCDLHKSSPDWTRTSNPSFRPLGQGTFQPLPIYAIDQLKRPWSDAFLHVLLSLVFRGFRGVTGGYKCTPERTLHDVPGSVVVAGGKIAARAEGTRPCGGPARGRRDPRTR
jgi:hypothetical protein